MVCPHRPPHVPRSAARGRVRRATRTAGGLAFALLLAGAGGCTLDRPAPREPFYFPPEVSLPSDTLSVDVDADCGAPLSAPASPCPGGRAVCALKAGSTPAALFAGPLVSWGESANDVVLANRHARYVIRGAAKGAAMYGTTGGHVVDVGHVTTDNETPVDPLRELVITVGMHIVRPESVTVLSDGATDTVARVEVQGPLVAFPTLDEALSLALPAVQVRHVYTLKAGDTALRIATHIKPTGSGKEQVLVGDVMFWGGEVAMYLPKHGDQTLPTTSQSDTLGFTRRRAAHLPWSPSFACAIAAPQPMSTIDAGAIKAFLHGNVEVPPEGITVTRALSCGGVFTVGCAPESGADLAAAMHDARAAVGLPTSDRVLVASLHSMRAPLSAPDVVVEVLSASDERLSRCSFDGQAQVRCPLPPGAARLRTGWVGDGATGLDSGGQPASLSGPSIAGSPKQTQIGLALQAPWPARLRVKATRDGEPLPVRVTLRAVPPSPQGSEDKLLRRTFADVTGSAVHLVPAGTYEVWLNAGPLSAMLHKQVTLTAGEETLVAGELPQVVDPGGWIGADTHVHSEPSSDSVVPVPRRLAGALCEGLQYVVHTDHDTQTDPTRWAAPSGALQPGPGSCVRIDERRLVVRTGAEVSTLKTGHFNVWPAKPGPEGAVAWFELGPEALLDAVGQAATPAGDARVVQCNHPRFESFSFFKAIAFDAAHTPVKLLRCDLMELINGIGHKETGQVLTDWLGLLARGVSISAVGTSDCHGISDFVGNPRTWVRVAQPLDALCNQPGAIDDALRAGHAVASAGPLLTLKVTRGQTQAQVGELLPAGTSGQKATIEAHIAAPDWLPLGTVDIYVGQTKVKSVQVSNTAVASGARNAVVSLPLAATASDTTVVAVHVPAPGKSGWPGIHRPAWAVTNPVKIDGDGDGKWFGQ